MLTEAPAHAANGALPELLDRMIAARQLTAGDARSFLRQHPAGEALAEEAVLRWLAREYGVPFAKLDELEPDKQVLSLFPARLLLRDELLPLRRVDNQIEIATSRLFLTAGIDGLKALTGLRLRPVLAPSEAVQRELKKRLGVGADTIGTLHEEGDLQVVDEGEGVAGTNLDEAAEDASIIRFVNQVLKDSIELRASDIHLEPFEDELRIRYRIDGVLQEVPVPAQIKKFQPAIVARGGAPHHDRRGRRPTARGGLGRGAAQRLPHLLLQPVQAAQARLHPVFLALGMQSRPMRLDQGRVALQAVGQAIEAAQVPGRLGPPAGQAQILAAPGQQFVARPQDRRPVGPLERAHPVALRQRRVVLPPPLPQPVEVLGKAQVVAAGALWRDRRQPGLQVHVQKPESAGMKALMGRPVPGAARARPTRRQIGRAHV